MANHTMTEGKRPHSIALQDRKDLLVTGVSSVDNFDEEAIVAYTDLGELTIRGTALQIRQLNVETGELSVEGTVSSLTYTDNQPRSTGFFAKLFR